MGADGPPVRKAREDGVRTRKAILHQAVSLATVEGLEGLSIGGLAKALGISKSGLYAHFGSKQELQLATIEEADRVFHLEVIDPALAAPEGLPRLIGVCDYFFDHLQRQTFPGGCFFAGAILEMGTRPAGEGADRRVPGVVHRPDRRVRAEGAGVGRAPPGRGRRPARLRVERHHPCGQRQLRDEQRPGDARYGSPSRPAPARRRCRIRPRRTSTNNSAVSSAQGVTRTALETPRAAWPMLSGEPMSPGKSRLHFGRDRPSFRGGGPALSLR